MAPLASVVAALASDPAIERVAARRADVLAVADPGRAAALGALAHTTGRRPVLVVTPTGTDAEHLAADLRVMVGAADVEEFPAWETLPFERVSPTIETMGRRLRVLWRLRDPRRAPRVVVAPVRAVLQRLGPGATDVEPVVVRAGGTVDRDHLVEALVAAGYRREPQVEARGEIAVRGSIVDVYPSTADAPVRIELWGDEVERLCEFAVADQRSTVERTVVGIFPAREVLVTPEVRRRAAELVGAEPWGRETWERLAEGQLFDGMESWLPWLVDDERLVVDLCGDDGLVVLVEPRRMRDRAAELIAEEVDLASTLARTWGADVSAGFPRLHLDFDRLAARTPAPVVSVVPAGTSEEVPRLEVSGVERPGGGTEAVTDRIARLAAAGYRITVAADGQGSAGRIAEVLTSGGLAPRVLEAGAAADPGPGEVVVAVAPVSRGFVAPGAKVAVIAEADVTGRRRVHRRARPRRRDSGGFFDDLQPGAYVVHAHHGVARYGGLVTRAIGGVERDYLLLEYRGGDKLYVPTDQIELVRHYTGGETPTVNRLGGGDWARTRAKVRAAVREVAAELVVLYQRRINTPGHAFSPDTPWQAELEAAFPYQETPDQLRAIAEVKADMESPHPMDRLVCGDVGFGKTEVAIRAAFKAVQDGRQVAVLVPTTLLATQHHQTFSERFAGYPVRVEMLSRFLTPAEARRVVAGLADGSVDVVIGTHRLLSDDVRFRRLGLLVVDEEQRFGVAHKEKIKQLQVGVDVLTLTATPIPRTLEMSLTGIRDLSLLNTPPADRQPILTYVGPHDERAEAEAIRRELLRDGQVFYVHNRVADIDHVAERLRNLVPEARIAVAHGQMDEGTLERVVLDFWEGAFDVLVCTTIIESGIDMPTVNTLVVDRAEHLGLGQLHQLRGRVGRSGQRAYAYLFHHPDRALSEEAYERLRTIGEATELGSGFKIAMRDLEIRGAGNLLGHDQSGHIAAVGYDLYCQMVTEAVAELKGEVPEAPPEITVDVPVDAHLPREWIPRDEHRLEAYRRLAATRTHAEVDDVAAEWADRYGPVPGPAARLLDVARLRADCLAHGIIEVVVTRGAPGGGPGWTARIRPVSLRASQQVRLGRLFPRARWKPETRQLVVPVGSREDPVAAVRGLLASLLGEPTAPGAAVSPAGASAAG